MLDTIRKLLDAYKYDGIPDALPRVHTPSGSRTGGLTANQLQWCDAKLGNGVFQAARAQAEAARGAKL